MQGGGVEGQLQGAHVYIVQGGQAIKTKLMKQKVLDHKQLYS